MAQNGQAGPSEVCIGHRERVETGTRDRLVSRVVEPAESGQKLLQGTDGAARHNDVHEGALVARARGYYGWIGEGAGVAQAYGEGTP